MNKNIIYVINRTGNEKITVKKLLITVSIARCRGTEEFSRGEAKLARKETL